MTQEPTELEQALEAWRAINPHNEDSDPDIDPDDVGEAAARVLRLINDSRLPLRAVVPSEQECDELKGFAKDFKKAQNWDTICRHSTCPYS